MKDLSGRLVCKCGETLKADNAKVVDVFRTQFDLIVTCPRCDAKYNAFVSSDEFRELAR